MAITKSAKIEAEIEKVKAKIAEQQARLKELEQKKLEAELDSQREGHQDVAWGSQIRSYVFQPYTMVKDHRTGYEVGNVDDVMDGNLSGFITAYLKMQ